MADTEHIEKIELEERGGIRRSPAVEQTRAAAIRDLLSENTFRPHDGASGPYHVKLNMGEGRFTLNVRDQDKKELPAISLPLFPFRQIVKDYFLICESYQAAYAHGDSHRLEAVDMARRGLHNEGAALLAERLEHFAATDLETARRLFTLLCVMHIGNSAPW